MAHDKKDVVLVSSHDHSYREVSVVTGLATWNEKYKTWSEYAGDEYLEEGDKVYEVKIAIS